MKQNQRNVKIANFVNDNTNINQKAKRLEALGKGNHNNVS